MILTLAIDFNRWACATYRANFPGVQVECGPVADYINRLPAADILLGGPPCQPFSSAGEGEGENDERDCIPDFVAAVARVKPRMFLMENVSGLLQAKHYHYFCRTIEQLEACGYVVKWRLLDAVSFGVPQFRLRVWVWGIRADLYAAGMRHSWPVETHAWPPPASAGLFGDWLLPGVTVGQALEITNKMSLEAHGFFRESEFDARRPSPTLRNCVSGCTDILIQSHADPAQSVELPAPTLRSGGNGHDGCCLRIIGGGGSNPHFVGDVRTDRDITHEPSTTISASHTHNALPMLAVRRIRGSGVIRRDDPATEPCPTVTTGGKSGLMFVADGPVKWHWSDALLDKHPPIELDAPSPTVVKNWHKGTPYGCLKWKKTPDGPWIRRLHPLECARLQSVPDSFLWPENLPKTHAYRIIGNGWASRMGQVFAERFAAVDPESETVIDLFCGAGLGAVGWHRGAWTYEAGMAGVA